jgi:hypothetical protein
LDSDDLKVSFHNFHYNCIHFQPATCINHYWRWNDDDDDSAMKKKRQIFFSFSLRRTNTLK